MRKILLTIFLAIVFFTSYSQIDPPTLYSLIRAKMWCRAVHLVKEYECNPAYWSYAKYHYYRGLAYQGAYSSDDEKCLQYKDSALYFVLDSYLTAFCFYLETDSLTPAILLEDSTRAKQIIESLDFRKFNYESIMLGLVDTSLSSALNLLSTDTTVSQIEKEKYSSIFRCILKNSRNMAIFCYLQKDTIDLLWKSYEVIYFSLDSTNGNKIIGYSSHDPSAIILEKQYSNGVLKEMRVYYTTGQKYEERKYRNGKCQGKVITYYESGEIFSVKHYKKGVLHGVLKAYSLSGSCLTRFYYKNGKRGRGFSSSPAW
jgi:hypothetical protein